MFPNSNQQGRSSGFGTYVHSQVLYLFEIQWLYLWSKDNIFPAFLTPHKAMRFKEGNIWKRTLQIEGIIRHNALLSPCHLTRCKDSWLLQVNMWAFGAIILSSLIFWNCLVPGIIHWEVKFIHWEVKRGVSTLFSDFKPSSVGIRGTTDIVIWLTSALYGRNNIHV